MRYASRFKIVEWTNFDETYRLKEKHLVGSKNEPLKKVLEPPFSGDLHHSLVFTRCSPVEIPGVQMQVLISR
jgi:hypothetical protein